MNTGMYRKNNIGKIFYINLDHRTDRRAFMEAQLEEIEIPWERFPAIAPSIESLVSPNGTYHEFYGKATERFRHYAQNRRLWTRAVGVFGVYISHFEIHTRMNNGNAGDYMILEDDCTFNEAGLTKVLTALEDGSIPEDWDIIRNCSISTSQVQKFTSSHKESTHAASEDGHDIFGGAHFSLFKGSSSRKVLDHLKNDVVLAIDAAYSTHALNVYHRDFGLSPAGLGTDIPKLVHKKLTLDRALRKSKDLLRSALKGR